MEGLMSNSKNPVNPRADAATKLLTKYIAEGQKRAKGPELIDQDIATVLLINAKIDLTNLEKQVGDYIGEHKSEIFHDVQDSVTKLLIALDDIDVSDNCNHRNERLELINRLAKLTEDLQNRIHEGHSDCCDCVQMTGPTITSDFDFIVTVEGDDLILNYNLLPGIFATPEADTPLTVVSVIGQPRSRKTYLVNSLLYYVREKAQVPSMIYFPTAENILQNAPLKTSFHDKVGVLIYTRPILISNPDGSNVQVYFLDIWHDDKKADSKMYGKLVDFCVSVSSSVILSEVYPVICWHWYPQTSFLSTLKQYQKLFQNLFVFIQNWNYVKPEDSLKTLDLLCQDNAVALYLKEEFTVPEFVSQFFQSLSVYFTGPTNTTPGQISENSETDIDYVAAVYRLKKDVLQSLMSSPRGNLVVTEQNIANVLETACCNISRFNSDTWGTSSDNKLPSTSICLSSNSENESTISTEDANVSYMDILGSEILPSPASIPTQQNMEYDNNENGEVERLKLSPAKSLHVEGFQDGCNMEISTHDFPVEVAIEADEDMCEDASSCDSDEAKGNGVSQIETSNSVITTPELENRSSQSAETPDETECYVVFNDTQPNLPEVIGVDGISNQSVSMDEESFCIIERTEVNGVTPGGEFCCTDDNGDNNSDPQEVPEEYNKADSLQQECVLYPQNEEGEMGTNLDVEDSVPEFNNVNESSKEEQAVEGAKMDEDCMSSSNSNKHSSPSTMKILRPNPIGQGGSIQSLGELLQDAWKIPNLSTGPRGFDTDPLLSFQIESETDKKAFEHSKIDCTSLPCINPPKVVETMCKNDNKNYTPSASLPATHQPTRSSSLPPTLTEFAKSCYRTKMTARLKDFYRLDKTVVVIPEILLPATHLQAQDEVQKMVKTKYSDYVDKPQLKIVVERTTNAVFEDFKTEIDNTRRAYNSTLTKINEKVNVMFNAIESELLKQPVLFISNFYYFSNLIRAENFITEELKRLPFGWTNHFKGLVQQQERDYRIVLQTLHSFLITFEIDLKNHLQQGTCFEAAEFHQFACQKYEKNSKNIPERELLQNFYMQSVDRIYGNFCKLNESTYRSELIAAKETMDAALSKYKELMEKRIFSVLLTDNCIESLHRHYADIIITACDRVVKDPKFSSHPWMITLVDLQEKLDNFLKVYKKKNRDSLLKISKFRRNALLSCETEYHDTMSSILNSAEFQLLEKDLLQHHELYLKQAQDSVEKMSSRFDGKLVKVWQQDLYSKLHVLQQRYLEENNRKKVAPAVTPAVTPSVSPAKTSPPMTMDAQDYPNPLPHGIGILFGVSQVRVGVYKDSSTKFPETSFLSLIAFDKEDILIGEDAKRHSSPIHLKDLLAGTPFSRHIFYYGKCFRLHAEEVLAAYFHKLKCLMEFKLQSRIESCVITVSGLTTFRDRTLLKVALTLAGFKTNLLLPCTTAMGLSYYLKNKLSETEKPVDSNVLMVYQAGDVLEAATVQVLPNLVSVSRSSGLEILAVQDKINWQWATNETRVQRKVKQVISDVLEKLRVQNAVLIVDFTNTHQAEIANAVKDKLRELNIEAVDLTSNNSEIISVSAALDASRNHHPDFQNIRAFPPHSNCSPTDIYITVNEKNRELIIHRHSGLFDEYNMRFRMDSSYFGSFKVTEVVKIHGKKILYHDYYFRSHQQGGTANVKIRIFTNSEGVITLATEQDENRSSTLHRLETMYKFMIPAEFGAISSNIQSILFKEASKYYKANPPAKVNCEVQPNKRVQLQLNQHEDTPASQPVAKANTKEVPVEEDEVVRAKKNLSLLVEEVKTKIVNDNTTNAMVIDKINATVQQCEELLGKPDAKSKQIELKMKILQTHAGKLTC